MADPGDVSDADPEGHARPSTDLDSIVDAVRRHTGLTGKTSIARVRRFVDTSDPVHGPGDDGAIVEIGDHHVVACGEAISPPFVSHDPYGAGVAAVLANVNDVAAMGGIPLGIVNTIVGPAAITSEVLRGMTDASAMYRVPIIGGHTTEQDGPPALSAFAIGEARHVLSMANVRPGQTVLFACCLDGEMRTDFPFFTTIARQGPRLGDDIRLLAAVAAEGFAVACKDVSMAGALGSLAMLLEFTGFGAVVDLGRLPAPAEVELLRWLIAFPTYAFWLTAEAGASRKCIDVFEHAGLICSPVGTVSSDSRLIATLNGERRQVIDLGHESITGLWR
jgi:uncharacterized protein